MWRRIRTGESEQQDAPRHTSSVARGGASKRRASEPDIEESKTPTTISAAQQQQQRSHLYHDDPYDDDDNDDDDKTPILNSNSNHHPDTIPHCRTSSDTGLTSLLPCCCCCCTYPHGVAAVTLVQALLALALVLSLGTVADCFLVVLPDSIRYGDAQIIQHEPPNRNTDRGLGLFFWETVSGECSWHHSTTTNNNNNNTTHDSSTWSDYHTQRGADWFTPHYAGLVAAGLTWANLCGAVLLTCACRRKWPRAVLLFSVGWITPVVQALVWTVLQTQVCRSRGCRPGRTLYLALGAVVCSGVAGVVLGRWVAWSRPRRPHGGTHTTPTPKTEPEEAPPEVVTDREQPSTGPLPPVTTPTTQRVGGLAGIPEGTAAAERPLATVSLADKLEAEQQQQQKQRPVYAVDENSGSTFSPIGGSTNTTPQRQRWTYDGDHDDEIDSDVGGGGSGAGSGIFSSSFSKSGSALFGVSSLFGSAATGAAVSAAATRSPQTSPKSEQKKSFGQEFPPATDDTFQLPKTSFEDDGNGTDVFEDDDDDELNHRELVFPSDPFYVMQEDGMGGRDVEILLGGGTERSDSEPDSPVNTPTRRRKRWLR